MADFAQIPTDLLDECLKRKVLARNHLPDYGMVPDCGFCNHKSGSFDSALLIHVWMCHEIKPKGLQKWIRDWLHEQKLLDSNGSLTDQKLRRFI